MKKTTMIIFGLSLSACVASALLWDFWPPMPGDQPSPKLVELFNQKLDAQLTKYGDPIVLTVLRDREYLPEAATHARGWLSEVREVVTHCKHNGRANIHNHHQYDLTLRSGEVFTDLTASIAVACSPRHDTPMRVTFEDGRVVRVTTDGSEREGTVAAASERVELHVRSLLQRDESLRPERYFRALPGEPVQEWGPP